MMAPAPRTMHPIPIHAAQRIAGAYGYDQVVVIGRRVGAGPSDPAGEHLTTFGVDPVHCAVAARAGAALRRFMGWPALTKDDATVAAYREIAVALLSREGQTTTDVLADDIERIAAEVDRRAGALLKTGPSR